jgi:hypothetical protein
MTFGEPLKDCFNIAKISTIAGLLQIGQKEEWLTHQNQEHTVEINALSMAL